MLFFGVFHLMLLKDPPLTVVSLFISSSSSRLLIVASSFVTLRFRWGRQVVGCCFLRSRHHFFIIVAGSRSSPWCQRLRKLFSWLAASKTNKTLEPRSLPVDDPLSGRKADNLGAQAGVDRRRHAEGCCRHEISFF